MSRDRAVASAVQRISRRTSRKKEDTVAPNAIRQHIRPFHFHTSSLAPVCLSEHSAAIADAGGAPHISNAGNVIIDRRSHTESPTSRPRAPATSTTLSRWDEGSQKVQLHCARVIIQQHFSRIISPIYTADTARVDCSTMRALRRSILALPARTCASGRRELSRTPARSFRCQYPSRTLSRTSTHVPPAPSH
ncbi:hypothetical protein B0H13DRAFT_2369825 [Mycena leptocephala]|nr:hypothetical protein B0H13DRAFT_2369825 [Mycena leptocephala]